MSAAKYLAITSLAAALATAVSAQDLTIGGDPLRIGVDAYGTIGVERLETGALVPQYYAVRAKGSALFFGEGEGTVRYGNGTSTFALWSDDGDRFTRVSHERPDAQTVRTVLAAGTTGVRVEQTVRYSPGNPYYLMTWVVSNGSPVARQTLRFVHGGDVALAGSDVGVGAWDAAANRVSVRPADGSDDEMGLSGEAGSAAERYYEAHFQLVREACKAGALPDAVDAQPHDAAYALQWSRASLAPGEAWTIRAREQWPGADAPPVHHDVSVWLTRPLFAWQLSYQTGTYFGTLTLSHTNGPSCTGPFWCVLDSSPEQRFMQPSGTLPDGREYLDVTAQVEAALGDASLDAGDAVTVPLIEVYMRTRQPPPDPAFTVYATAPGS